MATKGNFAPDMFLTRAERLKQMSIPDTSDSLVIVKPNKEALGFKYNCYCSQLEAKGISKPTFDQTVRECTRICENVWRKKKMEENAEYMPVLKYILFVAIFFVVVSFILLIILIYARPDDDNLLIISIICIVIAGTLTMVVIIKSMLSKPVFINLEQEIYLQLSTFLKRQNLDAYSKYGVEWVVPDSFYWLELHLNDGPSKHFVVQQNEHAPY